MSAKFYSRMHKLLSKTVMRVFRTEVIGSENEPETGSYIVCSNHVSAFDGAIVCAIMKRRVCYMAKKELFRIPLLKQFLHGLGTYPVDRSNVGVNAIKQTVKILNDGEAVGVFPQGTRYPKVDPRTTEIKSGIGMIAYRALADVLPVYIETPKNKVRFFHKTKVYIGPLIRYEEMNFSSGNKEEYVRVSRELFERCIALPENAVKKKDEITHDTSC